MKKSKNNLKSIVSCLLSAVLFVAMVLNTTACTGTEVIDPPPIGTTETQTTESSKDQTQSNSPISDPSAWFLHGLNYAIVKVIEKEDHTIRLHRNSNVGYLEYEAYKAEVVFTTSDKVKSWNIDTLYITVGSDDLNPGDVMLIQVVKKDIDGRICYYYPTDNDEYKSRFLVFSDKGTINADDKSVLYAFRELYDASYMIDDEEKWFQGVMTVEDVINFFTAYEEAYYEWLEWYDSLDHTSNSCV